MLWTISALRVKRARKKIAVVRGYIVSTLQVQEGCLQFLRKVPPMAKRYHKAPSQGLYAGMEARRTQEMEDAGMIREDRSAIANLPQDVMIKPYPMANDYAVYGLDDTIRSVDHQMKADSKDKKKGPFPEMY